MKKFFATILTIVYFTASSGATINLHYCMDKLMSWDLSEKNESQCSNCGMDKTERKGCCKDIHKVIKIDKDQKVAESNFQFHSCSDVLASPHFILPYIGYFSKIVNRHAAAHAPPRSGLPVYILICNFRI